MTKKFEVEYVYGGVLMHEDALMHSYMRLKGGKLDEAILYEQKLSKHKPGSVIKFIALDSEDALVKSSAVYQRMWDEPEQVAMWNAMTCALVASEEAYLKEAPAHPLELLDAYAAAYEALEPRERAVFLGQICAYIAGED